MREDVQFDDASLASLAAIPAVSAVSAASVLDTSVPDRVLADRIERWRYHLLKRYGGKLHPTDQQLADSLDLGSRRLAGGPFANWSFGPRAPRAALVEPVETRETSAIPIQRHTIAE